MHYTLTFVRCWRRLFIEGKKLRESQDATMIRCGALHMKNMAGCHDVPQEGYQLKTDHCSWAAPMWQNIWHAKLHSCLHEAPAFAWYSASAKSTTFCVVRLKLHGEDDISLNLRRAFLEVLLGVFLRLSPRLQAACIPSKHKAKLSKNVGVSPDAKTLRMPRSAAGPRVQEGWRVLRSCVGHGAKSGQE